LFEEVLGLWGNLLVLFGALVVLAKASDVAINNSVRVADITGFGRTTIGFILVAFSTSLPELLVSIFAAVRQESVGVARARAKMKQTLQPRENSALHKLNLLNITLNHLDQL